MRFLVLLFALSLTACASKKSENQEEKVEYSSTSKDGGRRGSNQVAKGMKKAKTMTKTTTAGATAGSVVCTLHTDKRTISRADQDGGGCVVNYDRYGETSEVASAANDLDYCNDVVAKIKGNLESAGFTCN